MKNLSALLLLICGLLIGNKSFCQDQNYERTICYRLKTPARFNKISNRYVIYQDTIFHTDYGFLINANLDTATIDKVLYVIATYPLFNSKKGQLPPDSLRIIGVSKFAYSNKLNNDSIVQKLPGHPINAFLNGPTNNGKILCIPKKDFDALAKDTLYSTSFWNPSNWLVSAGQLTVPFKLRPSADGKNFQMTTDVTLGAYFGFKKRISETKANYITIPVVAGLTFINVNDNTTVTTGTANATTGVYPGFTLSSGLILQLGNKVNIGFVLGRDYASTNGSNWVYNNRTWYSFAIGYSFIK